MSGKFGITSNITLDGTINPDFSQVESDAFQVEVNQRFPMFFSEKRPFFMEGMGLFNIAGTGGDGNMRTAVHTRRIVDPFWGTQADRHAGKTTFGVLNASDDSPEDVGDRGDAFADRDKLFTIGRATYALRRSDYVGAIVTDTESRRPPQSRGRRRPVDAGPRRRNRCRRRSWPSQTSAGRPATRSGNGAQVSYSYETRRFRCQQPGRALRPRFPDGHRVLQPHRFHGRVVVQRGEFLSRTAQLAAARAPVRSSPSAGTTTSRTATRTFCNAGLRFNFTRQGYVEVSRAQRARGRGSASASTSATTSSSSAGSRFSAG